MCLGKQCKVFQQKKKKKGISLSLIGRTNIAKIFRKKDNLQKKVDE